jgi:hypothetical protein
MSQPCTTAHAMPILKHGTQGCKVTFELSGGSADSCLACRMSNQACQQEP